MFSKSTIDVPKSVNDYFRASFQLLVSFMSIIYEDNIFIVQVTRRLTHNSNGYFRFNFFEDNIL